MTDDDLEARLRDLGRNPVDPALQARHLSAMAGVVTEPAPPRWRFSWRAVAAAAVVGFLAGSTGLAAAGELPGPAQDVAHDVLGRVGINVPRSTDGCPGGRAYRNHGEYVAEVEAAGGDVEAAEHSDCGMPTNRGVGQGGGANREPGVPRVDSDGDPCIGPPPWAGAHLTPEQRDELRAQRVALCGEDVDGADVGEDEETTTTTGG